ncbi:MAG: Ig-like domain-containing protein, partial [Pseudomonadales bacterium]|nr:Ig-like domain-containing protein [Pseudomonadales bacterium]
MRSLKVAACFLCRNLERGWGRLRKRSLNVLNLMGSKSSRTTLMLVALLGLSPMTYGLKEVVSVRLDPSTIAPGDAFVIYVTAQYDSSNSGGRSDDDYATTQYTLDGTSSCINNADATLGSTPVEYGPYAVTSPADISDGSYSVSVDIFSKNNCANSGQSSASTGAATATLTVSGTNDTPVAVDDASSVDEDGSVAIAVLANDSDSDGTLDATSVTITIDPSNGSVSVNAITGEVTYSGDANFVGSDTFNYTVEDNAGAVSSAATVTVTVGGVNDPPTLTGDRGGPVVKGGSYTFTTSDLFYQDIDDGDAEVTFSV